MISRLMAALIFLASGIGCAAAASFDCAKAETPFERAICDNPSLSQKDDALAIAYASALGGLSADASAVVKADQRAWLDYAQRACTEDARPMRTGDYDNEGVACLTDVFSSRVDMLEASRMQAGRRLYTVARFGAVPPDPNEERSWYTKVAQMEVSSPRIDGDNEEARAFNAFVEALPVIAPQAATEDDDARSSDVYVDVSIGDIASSRISLVVNEYWYGHGAAHGNYAISYLHFLLDDNRPMVAEDVLEGEDWIAAFAEYAFDALHATIAEGPWQESASELEEIVSDVSRWQFLEEGLLLQFQPYEVAAYVHGPPDVVIPWSVVEPYFAEGGESVARGPA